MATTATYKTFKSYIKSLFGWASGGTTAASMYSLDDNIGTLTSRWVTYEIPQRKKVSVEWQGVWGQTISLSASQPLQERVIFTAFRDCELKAAHFCQIVSATVTITESQSWTILLAKRGETNATGTLSTTYSVTNYMAGLTSCNSTGKNSQVSGSQSTLTQNVAHAPNRLHMTSTVSKRRMTKGDVITFRVKKGGTSGACQGAIFQGGTLHLRIEED